MTKSSFSWERWEALRTSADPDPMEVLAAIASFQQYFKAIERQAIQAARAQGHSWQEIGTILGKSKQSVWERIGRTLPEEDADKFLRFANKAQEARFKIGLDPT
ncbi:MAG: hypothetical protein ACLQRH_23090 [Acidimicrobiales bacterium]